ncbi:proton-coupled amino acid transporter-like protein pathetic [Planococcus citri]|uniref:proton-coupled amino acid transporter-like protein pathetic n=1 Tax=Planococcus citri TaxID=170843 RepID=UPI0031F7EE11
MVIKTGNISPCNEAGEKNSAEIHRAEKSVSYDPHDYGNENQPTIFWGPVCHFFKSIVGTGILALPYAFQSVGYAIAIPGTLLVGFIYTHILHTLMNVEYELCKILKTPQLTFAGVLQHAFELGPKPLRKFAPAAKFFLYFNYVVNGSMYNACFLVMIAENLKNISSYYYNVDYSMTTILSVVIIPLLVLGLVRRLKFLVPLSAVTTAFNFINIFLILYLSWNPPNVTDQPKAFNDVYEFPPFFGIVLGALSSTGIVIPLKNDMKTPRKFASLFGVLNVTLVGVTILYMVFGFLGYSKYGSQIQPNILANLPADNNLTLLVLVLYTLAICVSYTLFVYVAFDTIHSNIPLSEIKHRRIIIEYAVRLGLTILPYFIAIAVPNFKILVSIGGVISILIDVGVLPFVHMLLLSARKTSPKQTLHTAMIFFKDLLLILIALFLFAGGVANVVQKLRRFFD